MRAIKIENILDKDVLIKVAILDCLYMKEEWISAEYLSDILDCEKKTIHKYTNDLIKEIQLFAHPDLKFELTKGRGLRLFAKDHHIYSQFRQYLMGNTITINCLMAIFFKKENSLIALAEKNFISESTTRRKLSQIKKLLIKYEIEVVGKQGTYQLLGMEKNVRLYMYYSIWQIFETKNWPFFSIDINKIKKFINDVFEAKGVYLQEITKHRLSLFMGVCIIRFHQGHEVGEMGRNNVYSPYFSNAKAYRRFEFRLKEEFFLPPTEAKFIYFFMISQLGIHEELNKLGNVLALHKDNQSSSYKSSKYFLDYIEQNYRPLEETERKDIMVRLLCIHMFIHIFPSFSNEVLDDPIVAKMKKELPGLVKEARIMVESIYYKTQRVFLCDNDYLIDQMTQVLYRLGLGNHFEEKINIYLDTGLPSISEEILKGDILHLLKKQFNVRFLSKEEHECEGNSIIDLLVVTGITETLHKRYNFKKMVHVHPDMTKKDLKNLHQAMHKIVRHKESVGEFLE
ncbi:helix-turn-helix domain-containing protein [Enterococcus rotai]|uniref:helix-turn-helix domain-containing protein n=1 Tax=Enterococcus rotai TaxID=118060 RepID=UPI0032B5F25B